jgi:hypothetical protein
MTDDKMTGPGGGFEGEGGALSLGEVPIEDDAFSVVEAAPASTPPVAGSAKKGKTKTVATTPAKAAFDLEDEIGEAGAAKKYARVVIYGRNKTGKTKFLGSGGAGVLVVKLEEGTLSIRGSGASEYPKSKDKVETWEEVEALYYYLKAQADAGTLKYDILGFDTTTRMRQLILRHVVLGSAAFDPTKDVMTPMLKDYGTAGQKMIYWLAAFSTLPMHQVWLVQEKSGGEGDDEMSGYDIYPDLPTQVRNYVLGDADVIGRTFKKTVEDKTTGKPVTQFRIQFGPSENILTGDRTGNLPAVVVGANLRAVLDRMGFGKVF